MNLSEFLSRYGRGIAHRIAASLTPAYRPREHDQPLPPLKRPPLQAQTYAIQAAARSMTLNPGTMLVGEMGTGKTGIAAAAARLAGKKRILVLCPPHLTTNWKEEIHKTLPQVKVNIVATVTELERALRCPARPEQPQFIVMSQSAASLSWGWKDAVYWQPQRPPEGQKKRYPQPGDYRIPRCPACHEPAKNDYGGFLTLKELNTKRRQCGKCRQPLWQAGLAGAAKTPRIALAEYIKKRHAGRFDLLILDEVHEYKGGDTARGLCAGILSEVCAHTLSLTGTLMGGYSSTIFHLLYRHSKAIRRQYRHNDVKAWIRDYGFEETVKADPKDKGVYAHGRASARRFNRTQTREKPGISPKALHHLLGNSIFLRMEDVTTDLPPYQEQVVVLPLDDQVRNVAAPAGAPPTSQRQAYQQMYESLYEEVKRQAFAGSRKYLAAYLQALLSWPDACWREEIVRDPDPQKEKVIGTAPALDPQAIYPKEQALLDLARREKAAGRPLLIYASHTGQRDITGRLQSLLAQDGCKAAILKAGAPEAKGRREWIDRQLRQGIDALICNPRLVQTGLNLTQFPTIAWYETDYSVYTTRQASRRSWRIGQTKPVQVVYFAYEDTLQLQALQLISLKMKCSLALEGDLPEEGLSAFAAEEEDLLVTLARNMLADQESRGSAPAASLERILQEARQEREQEGDFLAGADWAPRTPAGEGHGVPNAAAETPAAAPPPPAVLDLEEFRRLAFSFQGCDPLAATPDRGNLAAPDRRPSEQVLTGHQGNFLAGKSAAPAGKSRGSRRPTSPLPASQDLFSYQLLSLQDDRIARLQAPETRHEGGAPLPTLEEQHHPRLLAGALNDAAAPEPEPKPAMETETEPEPAREMETEPEASGPEPPGPAPAE